MLISTILLNAQILKKTYYDWQSTIVKEEYFVNAKGEKNGLYKAYDQSGILALLYNFKNGLLNGLCTEYSTSSGRQLPKQKENWKDGVLNGMAEYYNGAGLVYRKGEWKDGKKSGSWMILDGTEMSAVSQTFYKFSEEEQKQNQYIKSTVIYVDDAIYNDGHKLYYYHPSGKLFIDAYYKQGITINDQIYYLPNGNIFGYIKFDSTGKVLVAKECAYPGYSKDSIPSFIKQAEIEKQAQFAIQSELEAKQKIQKAKFDSIIAVGDNDLKQNNYERARKSYEQARDMKCCSEYRFIEGKLSNVYHQEQEEVKKRRQAEEQNRMDCANILEQLRPKFETFNNKYRIEKISALFLDDKGNPLKKYKYPFGEDIYSKASKLVDTEVQQTRESEKDFAVRKQTLTKVNVLISRLNNLSDEEAKELNKKLKPCETLEQISVVLGY